MTGGEAKLIDQAGRMLGPNAVITDPKEIEPWVTDWRGRFHGATPAILAPASTEEVAQIVRLAAEHGVPLVPQGGNTGMAAGATPPADGSAILLSTNIEKVADMRYRFHEAQVGAQLRGDVVALWALREADCGQRRLRTLAWAGFDARMRKKFAYDTNYFGTEFETPPPDTSDDILLRDVCGPTSLIAGMRAATSNLAGAIAAYSWLIEGDGAAGKGLRDAERWREAYAQVCGLDCAPPDHEEPARSWTRGSRS